MMFLFSGVLSSQKMDKIPETRTIHVKSGDTIIVVSIPVKQLKSSKIDSKKLYYWYEYDKIHKNQGGFSGLLLHGAFNTFDGNGNLIESGNFASGLKTGIWKKWDTEGKIAEEHNWKAGILSGTSYYYINGNCVKTENYKNGILHGKVIVINDLGETETTVYKKGKVVEKGKREKNNKENAKTDKENTKTDKKGNKDKEELLEQEDTEGVSQANDAVISEDIIEMP